jgi:hypothetical protein
MWGSSVSPREISELRVGKGKIIWGGVLSNINLPELYPNYDVTAELLRKMGLLEDFESTGPIRYTHRKQPDTDIYFISNKTNELINSLCTFRVSKGKPELWDPLTGETRQLPEFVLQNERMQIPVQFEPYQSFFIVFKRGGEIKNSDVTGTKNFVQPQVLFEMKTPWDVSFDPKWGGPKNVIFSQLEDWTKKSDEGIKYYSGIANYHNTIAIPEKIAGDKKSDIFLYLGEVYNLARVWVNRKDMGVVWTAPYQVKITDAIVSGDNRIDIEVANLWPNRLIGDEQRPDDGIRNKQWPDWLLKNQVRTSGRYTFTTRKFYDKDAELLKSGLIGPVRILIRGKDNH